jgi:hypothetical protein
MSRWRNQDSAILEAVAAAERRHVQTLTTIAVAAELSITEQDVWTGLQALRDAEYITWVSCCPGDRANTQSHLTAPERGLGQQASGPRTVRRYLGARGRSRRHWSQICDRASNASESGCSTSGARLAFI